MFLHDKDPRKIVRAQEIRNILINEIWEFIKITENEKFSLQNESTYFQDVLHILKENRSKFPSLFNLLNNSTKSEDRVIKV